MKCFKKLWWQWRIRSKQCNRYSHQAWWLWEKSSWNWVFMNTEQRRKTGTAEKFVIYTPSSGVLWRCRDGFFMQSLKKPEHSPMVMKLCVDRMLIGSNSPRTGKAVIAEFTKNRRNCGNKHLNGSRQWLLLMLSFSSLQIISSTIMTSDFMAARVTLKEL